MAKVCEICGAKKSIGNTRKLLRGHRNVTGKREFKPNLQKYWHEGKRVNSCAKCIRSLTKQKSRVK